MDFLRFIYYLSAIILDLFRILIFLKNEMQKKIFIRRMTTADCEIIIKAFAAQNWNKPIALYHKYLSEQTKKKREVLIAETAGEFAGYLTILWRSDFAAFRKNEIPEIADLNVLIKFRNRGIARELLNAAENLIAEKHKIAGIRVGLTEDYGAAQRIYVRRGYAPDGLGISQNGIFPRYGDKITVDDALNLSLKKTL
jgi:ribosomal protein S18 acetylase RimI-like enzyme